MGKRFLFSVLVMVIMLIMFGYLVHGVLLAVDYGQIPNLYRTPEEQMAHLPLMLPAHIVAAFAFVWLFVRTRDDGPSALVQGVRFGLAIAALMIVHKFIIYYSLQPIPGSLAIKQITFDVITVVIMGIVIAYLNAGRTRRLGT